MHRRRRTPTRIIQRKSSSDQILILNSSVKKKGKAKKLFFLFFFIFILAAISYFLYFQNINEGTKPDQVIEVSTTDDLAPADDEIAREHTYQQPEKMIQIEVLNGCGTKGIAKIFKSYLRQQGFDVVNTENYRIHGKIFWNVEFSKVIDQIGNEDYATAVAQSLGINEQHVSSVDNPSPICDVTFVIGKDFNKIKGFKEFSK